MVRRSCAAPSTPPRAYGAALQLPLAAQLPLRLRPPPLVRGRRIKPRYAHQGGRNPPVIVIHGTQAQRTPEDYRRSLSNCFRKAFDLHGTPVRVEFRSDDNPFAGRRNKLTPLQDRKRKTALRRKRH